MLRGFVVFRLWLSRAFSVQASTHARRRQKATDITLVRGFCGLGFHRGP
jgi:hypothetical protein